MSDGHGAPRTPSFPTPSSGWAGRCSSARPGSPAINPGKSIRMRPPGRIAANSVRELSSYIAGFILAALLTSAAFGLVWWSLLPHSWLMVAIGAFALIQIVVHFRFFLHIDLSRQKREDLQLILFSALILAIMVGGTIWILGDLAARM